MYSIDDVVLRGYSLEIVSPASNSVLPTLPFLAAGLGSGDTFRASHIAL